MKPLNKLLPLLLAGFGFTAHAQQAAINSCAAARQAHHPAHPTALKGTVADPAEDQYDVRYSKLDIGLTNTAPVISGNVLTQAVTVVPMSRYAFELTSDLTVDSVQINGQARTFSRTGNVTSVTLPAALPAGTAFGAQVFYHGQITSGSSSFFDRGLRTVLSTASNRYYTFTLGEPYSALDWWPCKQSLTDKIDSSDVWITVDSSLKAGSNGLLQRITTVAPGKRRFEWKSRNPIDYYLISASVGVYDDYSYYMHFTGSMDSMLIQNYIYPNTLGVRKPILDSVALMVNHFSELFGRYPFWREKYGHCQAPLNGGEEHQTMTTIGIWDQEVVPHELSHQWFGDHVTCGSWKDIWLNEGFASYAEYLYVEHFYGANAALNKIMRIHLNARFEPFSPVPTTTGAVYVDDTTDEERIFSSRLTYNKGASVVHTLRFEAGNDSLFFSTLRLYQQQFANGTATTEQLKALVAQQYGRNMDTFFNQWVYSSGWPVYNARWNQKNGHIFLRLDQIATGDYTAHKYSTPIEVRFYGPQGDTLVRFRTDDQATFFSFPWSKTVQGIEIDPNDWLLDGPGNIQQDNSLSIGTAGMPVHMVYPNPVRDALYVQAPDAARILITDIAGRTLLNEPLSANVPVNVRPLSPGIYLYRLQDSDGRTVDQGRLVRE